MALMSLCIGVHISIYTHLHMSICTHVCEECKEYPSKCACLYAKALFVCVCAYMCGSVYVNTCNICMMLVC